VSKKTLNISVHKLIFFFCYTFNNIQQITRDGIKISLIFSMKLDLYLIYSGSSIINNVSRGSIIIR
jgi:hypothetical protein